MNGLPKVQSVGGDIAMVKRLIRDLDKETARLKMPMIIHNAETFPTHTTGPTEPNLITRQLDII